MRLRAGAEQRRYDVATDGARPGPGPGPRRCAGAVAASDGVAWHSRSGTTTASTTARTTACATTTTTTTTTPHRCSATAADGTAKHE